MCMTHWLRVRGAIQGHHGPVFYYGTQSIDKFSVHSLLTIYCTLCHLLILTLNARILNFIMTLKRHLLTIVGKGKKWLYPYSTFFFFFPTMFFTFPPKNFNSSVTFITLFANTSNLDQFNPFPHNNTFRSPWETSLLKTRWEKEKLLVTSNFSFTHSVFYLFRDLSEVFIKFKIVICKLFQFGRV